MARKAASTAEEPKKKKSPATGARQPRRKKAEPGSRGLAPSDVAQAQDDGRAITEASYAIPPRELT